MDSLYINGCSNSAGTIESLGQHYKEKTWGSKLSKLTGHLEFVNDSSSGGSNERIVRTTVSHIVEKGLPDLAVIQFTSAERFEEVDPESEKFINFTPYSFVNIKEKSDIQTKIKTLDPTVETFCNRHRNMYKHHQRKLLEQRALVDILCLQNLLENYGIDYVFILWSSMLPETMGSKLYKSINKSNVFNSSNNIHYSMHQILQSYDFKICEKVNKIGAIDNHYMEDAQEFIAHRLVEFIDNRVTLLPKHINRDTEYKEVLNQYG